MQLKPYEIAVLLKLMMKLTYAKISDTIGYSESSAFLRSIYAVNGGRMQPIYLTSLQNMLFELKEMPFPIEWLEPLAQVHALREVRHISEIERTYKALSRVAENISPYAPKEDRLAAHFFAGQYHMSFAFHPRRVDNKQEHFEKAVQNFRTLITKLDGSNVLQNVIITKCVGNIVALYWNGKPHDERDNPEMRAIIEELNFFPRIEEYIKLFPKLDTAPFTALAIASGLNETDRFEELYAALVATNPKYKSYQEYDEDFNNFKGWLDQQNGSKNNFKKGEKS